MSALKALVSFYTIFHLNIEQKDMDDMERKFYLTPLIGLLFGLIVTAEAIILTVLHDSYGFGNPYVFAVLALLTAYAGSKFLHFDGLTDFGDGMIVSGQREDHTRALKDTLVGAGGIGVALITVLCSIMFYAMYDNKYYLIVLLPMIEVFVKNAMVVAASVGLPGKGMAARQVEMTTGKSAVLGFIVSIVCIMILLSVSIAFFQVYNGTGCGSILDLGLKGLVTGMIVSAIIGIVMARTANRVFGMVNGDILGATNEIARPFLAFFIMLIVCVTGTVI